MRVLQALSQLHPDLQHGVGKLPMPGPRRCDCCLRRRVGRCVQPFNDREQFGGAGGGNSGGIDRVHQIEQRDAAEVRHADGRQPQGLVALYRMDRRDIRVLEHSQGVRFARAKRRGFDDDQPPSQRRLSRQIDPRKSPAPKFFEQLEIEPGRTWLGPPRF